MNRYRWQAVAFGVGIVLVPATAGGAEKMSKREALREKFQTTNVQFSPYSSQDAQGVSVQYEPYYQSGADQGTTNLRTRAPTQTEAAEPQSVANEPALVGGGFLRQEVASRPYASDYVIYQTGYQADIEEDIALVQEHVQLEVFRKSGVTRIPLVNSNVGLKEVSLNRRPSMINREVNMYVLLVDKPGKYTLDLQFFVKLNRERERGPGQFSFETLPSPISILDVEIHEPQMDIFVEPSIKLEKEFTSERTLATAVLPYTEQLQIRWAKAAEKIAISPVALEPRLTVEATTLVSVGEGIAQFSSQLNYSILQSEVSNLKVVLPQDVTILDVHGQDIRDWKIVPQDGRQLVDVYLSRGMKGPYALQVTYEETLGEGSTTAQLPQLIALGAERDRGYVGIQARSNVEISFGRTTDADEIDVKELPAGLWGQASHPILLAYQYFKHPHAVEIDVKKHAEIPVLVATIDAAHYLTLLTVEGKMLTSATYQVRNNVKQFARLELPEGASLLSCFVSGQPVKPARDAQGHVLLPLQKSEALESTVAQFPVEVIYMSEGQPLGLFGRLTIRLPRVDIPSSQLAWWVYAPEDNNYWRLGGDVRWSAPDRGSVPGWLSLLSPLRKAAQVQFEQVGAQYTPGRQVADQRAYDAMKSYVTKGALPIRVNIPAIGEGIHLSKLLVTHESPTVILGYVRNLAKAGGVVAVVVFLLIVMLGQLWIQRQVIQGASLTMAHKALGLAVLIGLAPCLWLAHAGPAAVYLALIVVCVSWLIASLRAKRPKDETPETK